MSTLDDIEAQIEALEYVLPMVGAIPMYGGTPEYGHRIVLHEMHLRLIKRKALLTTTK